MDDLQTVINEINKRLNTDFGGSEDWELGRQVELYYLLGFCMTLSKQETQYVYSTSTGKEFMREPTKEERESVNRYLESISKPTEINFWEVLKENNNVKSKE